MSKTAGFLTLSAVAIGIAVTCFAIKIATEKEQELSLPLRWTAGVVWVEAIPCLYRLCHCRKPYNPNAGVTKGVNALKRLLWDPWFIALGILTVGGLLATNYVFAKQDAKGFGELLTVVLDIPPAVMFLGKAWRSFQRTPLARRMGCYRNEPAAPAAVPFLMNQAQAQHQYQLTGAAALSIQPPVPDAAA